MKFQVKVGQEFPCYVAEEHTIPLVVQLTQSVNLPSTEGASHDRDQSAHPASATKWLALLIFSVGFFPPMFYGWATGDFSALKSLAESGRDLLLAALRLMGKS